MKVMSFGEILLRLAAPGYTKLFQKGSLDATFCGGEANVAVSLSNLGIDSIFLTKLPENDVAKASLRALNYFGVNTDKVIYGDGRMGLYYLEKGASQRSSKVIYDRKYSAISMAETSDFNWDELFDGIDWFHWTGINPALSDNLAEIMLDALKAAKSKGITVSCDLNYRANLWSPEKAKSVMTKLLPYVDVCVGNEEDAHKVLGITAENNNVESAQLNYSGYEYIAKEISRIYGCRNVAFTLRESFSASRNGWSGMLYDAASDKSFFSKKYDVQIIDRVGGGDSFTAALIYSLMTNKDKQFAIDFAVTASCLKQTLEGDFNRCSVDEIENVLQTGGNGRVSR